MGLFGKKISRSFNNFAKKRLKVLTRSEKRSLKAQNNTTK